MKLLAEEAPKAPESVVARPNAAARQHEDAVLERVRKLVHDGNYGVAEIARAINYSHSAISSLVRGRYTADPSSMLAALANWLLRINEPFGDADADMAVIETPAIAQVRAVCDCAHQEHKFTAAIGRPGCGKTVGIRAWEKGARAEGIRFVLVTCDVSTTWVALLRRIAEGLGVKPERLAAWTYMEVVTKKLKSDPAVIVIDEAQHLNVKALEVLRGIHDLTGTGVAMIGSLALEWTLKDGGRRRTELQQLQDRLHLLEKVSLLSVAETTEFARKWWGGEPLQQEVVGRLRNHSGGSPRRLVRLLTHARTMCQLAKQAALSVEIVDAAADRLFRHEVRS